MIQTWVETTTQSGAKEARLGRAYVQLHACTHFFRPPACLPYTCMGTPKLSGCM